jgi:Fe-S-cluster containining protein
METFRRPAANPEERSERVVRKFVGIVGLGLAAALLSACAPTGAGLSGCRVERAAGSTASAVGGLGNPPTHLTQDEIDAMAARTGMDPAAFEAAFVKRVGVRRSLKERLGGDCVLLDEQTRKCTAYDERPRQCRTWPFWDSNLRSPEAWAEAAEACPGCNKGSLVPLETIVEQASKIRV